MRFKNNIENVIEFINGESTASVTFNSRRHITKIKKLHASDPDEFVNYVENTDGSVYATIPLSWIKISKPRQISDEQKEAAARRLKEIRAKQKE